MTQEAPLVERGLQYWMKQVVAESEKASKDFAADPVHDLRVAIRRCRAIAQGFVVLDPHPFWTKMRKSSKPLFAALGELRDVQVLMGWVEKLSAPEDPVRQKLIDYCARREQELKSSASAELARFDRDRWLAWASTLEERSETIPPDGDVFQLMALERWTDAYRLHAVALRNRSKLALHALRIGIKKFRYVVENFLPELHDRWKKDLKRIQDLLGEIHDLDVLWDTAKANHAFASPEERQRWLATIKHERSARLEEYRSMMLGRSSLWHSWRSALPQGDHLHSATLKFFETWAFYRDPDLSHTHRVLQMSHALFDELSRTRIVRLQEVAGVSLRDLLTVAVLTHEATQGNSQKPAKRLQKSLQNLPPPPAWTSEHLKILSVAARHHSGSMPSESRKSYASLKRSSKRVVDLLAGILRLAESFDSDHKGAIQRIQPAVKDSHILIEAVGYDPRTPNSERIAKARHLLETICRLPILIRSEDRIAT